MNISDMTTEELEEVLAHFGTKGMHWGQRKSSSSSSGPKKPRTPMTRSQKQLMMITISIGASTAATLLLSPVAGVSVGALSRIGMEVVNARDRERQG